MPAEPSKQNPRSSSAESQSTSDSSTSPSARDEELLPLEMGEPFHISRNEIAAEMDEMVEFEFEKDWR